MAIGTFSPPKGWEDWTTLLLGIWLCASSSVLQFNDPLATENLVVVGFLVIIGELYTFYTLRLWEEWINIILGAWLIVSPWVLGVTTPPAKANTIVVGALLLALALYEMWDDRRDHSPSRTS
ncbi:MAG: SPW repeat protein [Xanthobacteraceae bacterium]